MSAFFVTAAPTYLDVPIGQSVTVDLTIGNTSSLIDAYGVRVFGLDPEWVLTTPARLSLFPGDTGGVQITAQLPDTFPSGLRQLSLHVQSENDPSDFSIVIVTVNIAAQPRVTLGVDPVSVTGGSAAQFGMVVANHGNSIVDVEPSAIDPEDRAEFVFQPGLLRLLPGEQAVIQAGVRAPRPWIGQPRVRALTFTVRSPQRLETMATFVQRPRIGRWLVSLLGLITAAAVFAAVLSRTFSDVVDEAKVGDDVVNAALADGASGERVPVSPATVTGRVVSVTTGEGIAGVEAQLFPADNGNVPIGSAATGSDGTYAFSSLNAGTYRVQFSGAGFQSLWYPEAVVFADATDVKVETGAATKLADVPLSGEPGTVQGQVSGENLTGATITLLVPGRADPSTEAVVATASISADGSFTLADVPTPADYELVVEQPGSATETRQITLTAAGELDDLQIQLRAGDGVITGHVFAGGSALGGVTVEASDGTNTVETVSLTQGDIGTYTLRNLAAPGRYTVTVSRPGFTTQSRTLSVEPGQPVVSDVVLNAALGGIQGSVLDANGQPLGGVTVSVTGGAAPSTTTTISQGEGAGTWSVGGLTVPQTYTVTFSKTGYVSQTRLVTLDGTTAGGVVGGIDAALVRDVATIRGLVVDRAGAPVARAAVTLTNGTEPRETFSADDPPGAFIFGNVPPGSYTLAVTRIGAESAVQVVTVRAGEDKPVQLTLGDQASLSGQVLAPDGTPLAGLSVRLYLPAQFPGSPAAAVRAVTTAPDGTYVFSSLEAPTEFVVAVFLTPSSVDPLDSELTSSVPGAAVVVPTFTIPGVI